MHFWIYHCILLIYQYAFMDIYGCTVTYCMYDLCSYDYVCLHLEDKGHPEVDDWRWLMAAWMMLISMAVYMVSICKHGSFPKVSYHFNSFQMFSSQSEILSTGRNIVNKISIFDKWNGKTCIYFQSRFSHNFAECVPSLKLTVCPWK